MRQYDHGTHTKAHHHCRNCVCNDAHTVSAVSAVSAVPRRQADPEISAIPRQSFACRCVRFIGNILLKNVDILSGGHGIPKLIAIAVVVDLHLRKKQMLLSIAGGTVVYMLLVQFVF